MAKKKNSFLVGVLGAMVALLVLGGLTRGFNEWDVKEWFGSSNTSGESESDDISSDSLSESLSSSESIKTSSVDLTKAGQVFTNIDLDFDIANGTKFNYSRGAYMYQNASYFENSTINYIGLPVKSLTDYSVDNTFTVYVVNYEDVVAKGTNYVSKHQLVIEANSYSSNDINSWVYFETNIVVGEGESLAFLSSEDTIICTYPSTTLKDYKFYIDCLDGASLIASPGNILFDVYKEK